jgi:hypothetical protein
MEYENLNPIFEQLYGEQLSAVTFVQDYLQLWFDGPGINVTNPLTVDVNGKSATSWKNGFRDLLCEQIGKKVESISMVTEQSFTIWFSDRSKISVSLRTEGSTSPEAIYGHGFKDNGWFVL